jgi:hypothetical protein
MLACRANDFAATGIVENCTSQEVMTLDPNPALGPGFAQAMMGAAVVTYSSTAYNGTRQELVTTFDCGAWKPSCLVFAHYALSWLLHDIIPGQRRVLFSIQVDDLLSQTGKWLRTHPEACVIMAPACTETCHSLQQ